MICQAIYDNLESIPEALRDEFEQVDGKWRLKETAVPGVGPLFNAALAANEKKAVGQVKTRNERIQALEAEKTVLETERDDARDELSTYKMPGGRVLSKEDAELFDSYTKLGTPKDLETKLGEFETLQTTVTNLERSTTVAAIAAKANVNAEVLTDWAGTPEAQGVEFFLKTVTTKEAGKDVTNEVPFARYEKDEAGKKITVEENLMEFAKTRMPEWKFNALTAVVADDKDKNKTATTGVRLPALGSAAAPAAPAKDGERPVDRFNAARSAGNNPLRPNKTAPTT